MEGVARSVEYYCQLLFDLSDCMYAVQIACWLEFGKRSCLSANDTLVVCLASIKPNMF